MPKQKAETDPALEAVRTWRKTLNDAYDSIEMCIAAGDAVEASRIMTVVTQHQAQTSVAMRNILIKQGRIPAAADDV